MIKLFVATLVLFLVFNTVWSNDRREKGEEELRLLRYRNAVRVSEPIEVLIVVDATYSPEEIEALVKKELTIPVLVAEGELEPVLGTFEMGKLYISRWP